MDLRALQRAIQWNASSVRRFVLLAPKGAPIPDRFEKVQNSPKFHSELTARLQRFRGEVYLEDGAIGEQDLTDGRHWSAADEKSWHLLVLDSDDKVCACTRYLPHSERDSFSQLAVSGASLASCPSWGAKLKTAVESEIAF